MEDWTKEIDSPAERKWEEFYRNRFQHDRRVRTTHGVNCTGSCSWEVFVKDGIVTWELQATDYPQLEEGLPPYEPRGCQRGISFSWYLYSPIRVKYPYGRGTLIDYWRALRKEYSDPVVAWSALVSDHEKRQAYQTARGKGGFRRISWDEALEMIAASVVYTVKQWGPDRVIGFSPIPAMSQVSYAAGSRFLSLLGGVPLSFYDWYCDLPPASPEIWGEQTDVHESADWYNARFIAVMGANLNMTRTPDTHFISEVRHAGAKLTVFSPDFSQVAKYADYWIPVHAGQDTAFWMAVDHVLLKEFYVERQVPYFVDYLKRYTDMPFLVEVPGVEENFSPFPEGKGAGGLGLRSGRYLRSNRIGEYAGQENGDWKLLVWDQKTGRPRLPKGSIGFRWAKEDPGKWNLQMEEAVTGESLDPELSFIEASDAVVELEFDDFEAGGTLKRGVPVRYVETDSGRVAVATVFDLLMAQFGVGRGLPGEYPQSYDEAAPYTPAWQERLTGIHRDTLLRFAREWGHNAEKTRGKNLVIIGAGANHWYHNNLIYRSAITALMLTGSVGVNGGGLAHYVGQEKLVNQASWSAIAFATDWKMAPRQQNTPSFHYVHSDQWRYERGFAAYDSLPGTTDGRRQTTEDEGRELTVSGQSPTTNDEGEKLSIVDRPPSIVQDHTIDHQVRAVRRGWLPFFPQFDRSPLKVVQEAQASGATSDAEIVQHVVEKLHSGQLKFAVEDPDAPENWPRVWFIWRGNAIGTSAKGHEFFMRHYLGTHSNAIAREMAQGCTSEVNYRPEAPTGKMDLVVDLNFRMDTSALYSDLVLPAATWYEKDDLNTTDMHSFINPMQAVVPPAWESRSDWEIYKAVAHKVSELAQVHLPEPVKDIVMLPLQHDTPDELAQPEVRDWKTGEVEPLPGVTMPKFRVIERDYAHLYQRMVSLGRGVEQNGVAAHGLSIPAADEYQALLHHQPRHFKDDGRRELTARGQSPTTPLSTTMDDGKGNGDQSSIVIRPSSFVHRPNGNGTGEDLYPSLEDARQVANAILRLDPASNGELAHRAFQAEEHKTGLDLSDLAEGLRDIRYSFADIVSQPRRVLNTPTWSGIVTKGRPYSPYTLNVERLVPWRTLTGRQHFYLDHEDYLAWGEHLPVYKPKPDHTMMDDTAQTLLAGQGGKLFNYITPHGKWSIHSTYSENHRMVTLSRGGYPVWMNEKDAAELGIRDNDWVELYNDNGVFVQRANVSARIPPGTIFVYHATERTIGIPKSPSRGYRAGMNNSLTRARLKPVLMTGGYAQFSYAFNYWGPTGVNRDTFIFVRKVEKPEF